LAKKEKNGEGKGEGEILIGKLGSFPRIRDRTGRASQKEGGRSRLGGVVEIRGKKTEGGAKICRKVGDQLQGWKGKGGRGGRGERPIHSHLSKKKAKKTKTREGNSKKKANGPGGGWKPNQTKRGGEGVRRKSFSPPNGQKPARGDSHPSTVRFENERFCVQERCC